MNEELFQKNQDFSVDFHEQPNIISTLFHKKNLSIFS